MNPRFHNEVISKVRKTISRMTHPVRTFAKAGNLIKMNIPPLMGRRDAAYDKVRKLLDSRICEHADPADREKIYLPAAKLLDVAVNDTLAIVSARSGDEHEAQERQLLNYLRMLKNILLAATGLAAHARSLFHNENELNHFMEDGKLFETDKVFFESEKNIARSLDKLLQAASGQILKLRSNVQKDLNRYDAGRYKKSFEKYSVIYGSDEI